MEGTPPAVLHLLQYAQTLSDSHLYRPAALVYSACATSPSINPLVQTRLLYNAALHLHLHLLHTPPSPTSPRDRHRALEFLSKSTLLLNSLPHSPHLFFNVTALTLSLHLHAHDYHAARNTIRLGLQQAASRKGDLRWWAYFQSRLMHAELHLADHSVMGLHRVASIATDTALEMRRHSHYLGACAFALARAQYLLALPRPDYPAIEAGLKAALKSLQMVQGPNVEADVRFLDLVRCLLRAIVTVRRGDFGDENVTRRVKNAYNKVCESVKDGSCLGWQWATPPVLAALTRHIVAVVNRGKTGKDGDGRGAELALRAGGVILTDGDMVRVNPFRDMAVPEGAMRALLVALMESLVRQRMMSLEFGGVKGLVSKMVELVFPGVEERRLMARVEGGADMDMVMLMRGKKRPNELRLSSCVLLLCGEYHNLLGKVVDAQIAGKFLSAVLSTAGTSGTEVGGQFVSDAWQKALSLQLMLTGDPRQRLIVPTIFLDEKQAAEYQARGVDIRFGNIHILALAWFTTGVYQMRRGDVLEAREAMTRALELMGPSPDPLEQVVSNAKAVASGLCMSGGQLGGQGERLISEAVASATALGDLVTLSRALRQLKKLENRRILGYNSAQRIQLESGPESTQRRCQNCFVELKRKQMKAKPQLVDDPTR